MEDYSRIRTELEKRLESIRKRTDKVEASLHRARDHDSQERAIEAENDEVLEHLDASGLEEIEAIEQALQRIESGTFGVCVVCRETVAPARLEALPFARTCIKCAKQ